MIQISTNGNSNPGVVPPWFDGAMPPTKNPGIVPPWLEQPFHTLPIDDGDTQFVSEPVSTSPMTLTDAILGR